MNKILTGEIKKMRIGRTSPIDSPSLISDHTFDLSKQKRTNSFSKFKIDESKLNNYTTKFSLTFSDVGKEQFFPRSQSKKNSKIVIIPTKYEQLNKKQKICPGKKKKLISKNFQIIKQSALPINNKTIININNNINNNIQINLSKKDLNDIGTNEDNKTLISDASAFQSLVSFKSKKTNANNITTTFLTTNNDDLLSYNLSPIPSQKVIDKESFKKFCLDLEKKLGLNHDKY